MIDDVLARLRAVVEGDPFLYTETHDPFDFDHDPAEALEHGYRLEPRLARQEGYLGPNCNEQWEIGVWLTRRTQGDATGARDAVLMDISSLCAALSQDGTASGEYEVLDDLTSGEAQTAEDTDAVIGLWRTSVEFDRAL